MKISVVSKIRNEIDIIEPFLRHLDSLFDSVYLLDHKSKDGTTEILKEAVQQRPDWQYYFVDFNGHFHKQVSNAMMEKAFSEGADFLFILDADEFLPFKDRGELESSLNQLSGFDGVGAFHWKNCIPCDFETLMFTPETEIWYPPVQSSFTKVVVPRTLYEKSNHTIYITQGNHHVCDVKNQYFDKLDLGTLIHVPIRSREQTEKKTIIKCIAYLAIENRNEREGFHNFEMLAKVANNSLDDETLRGFTYLYESNKVMVRLSTKDLVAQKYSISSLNKLGVPFSETIRISPFSVKQSSNSVIADALLNWKEEDPKNFDFVVNGNVIHLIPHSEVPSQQKHQFNPKKISINDIKKTGKKLFTGRLNSYIENYKSRKLILNSMLFDLDWYLKQNPDVETSRIDPIAHYLIYGAKEGRTPGPRFDGNRYLFENKDVDINTINPLVHYILFGKVEGREIHNVIYAGTSGEDERSEPEKPDYYQLLLTKTIPVIPFENNLSASKSVDVIVCVHDALLDVKACMASLLPTLGKNHQLIIVDDQSNTETKAYLEHLKQDNAEKITLVHTPEQSYYAKAANFGFSKSNADFVIFLNSDTIVTEGWIEKLLAVAYSDARIGVVGPLSNAAGFQSIPSISPQKDNSPINILPSNMTLESLNDQCESWVKGEDYPVLPFLHGFCLGVKRETIEKVGQFDAVNFPKGFGEEIDFGFRVSEAGYLSVAAMDTFVYHAKSKSYDPHLRRDLMSETYRTLQKKYSLFQVQLAQDICKYHTGLVNIRARSVNYFYQNDNRN